LYENKLYVISSWISVVHVRAGENLLFSPKRGAFSLSENSPLLVCKSSLKREQSRLSEEV